MRQTLLLLFILSFMVILPSQSQETPIDLPDLQPVTSNADWTPVEGDFDGMDMVLVPPGQFQMGNDPDGQYWDGTEFVQGVPDGGMHTFITPFWISKYEVTNAEFRAFIDAGGYDDPQWWTDAGWAAKESMGWTESSFLTDSTLNADNQPVVGISWYEAVAYANWRGMRLPTEAQWEYAARGPDSLDYPWGDAFDGERVNFCDTNCQYDWKDSNINDGYEYTATVGNFADGVSWAGAMDMSGNVWEWVSTPDVNYPYDMASEVMQGDDRRVFRGGSWLNDGVWVCAACRTTNGPSGRFNDVGFRLVWPQDLDTDPIVITEPTAAPTAGALPQPTTIADDTTLGELIFEERFDEQGDWISRNETNRRYGVSNGVFNMEGLIERNSRWFWHSFNFLTDGKLVTLPADFEMQITMSNFTSTSGLGCMSFALNLTDEFADLHQLILCDTGNIWLYEVANSEFELIANVESDLQITDGSAHTFAFRVEDGVMTARIGDIVLDSVPYTRDVTSFGFILLRSGNDDSTPTLSMQLDNFVVYTLDTDPVVVDEPTAAPTAGASAQPTTMSLVDTDVNGSILFISGRSGNNDIWVMDPDGSNQRNLTLSTDYEFNPAPSLDGRRIAFSRYITDTVVSFVGNRDIWVMNRDGSDQVNLTDDPNSDDRKPTWSPDGTQIVWIKSDQLFIMNSNGSGQRPLTSYSFDFYRSTQIDWSPDGNTILLNAEPPTPRLADPDIFRVDVATGDVVNLTNAPDYRDLTPAWSPDGQRIVFITQQLGGLDLVTMPENGGALVEIEIDNEQFMFIDNPDWAADGRILFDISPARTRGREIYIINPDGSNITRLTNEDGDDIEPKWLPAINDTLVVETPNTVTEAGPDRIYLDDEFGSASEEAWITIDEDGIFSGVRNGRLVIEHAVESPFARVIEPRSYLYFDENDGAYEAIVDVQVLTPNVDYGRVDFLFNFETQPRPYPDAFIIFGTGEWQIRKYEREDTSDTAFTTSLSVDTTFEVIAEGTMPEEIDLFDGEVHQVMALISNDENYFLVDEQLITSIPSQRLSMEGAFILGTSVEEEQPLRVAFDNLVIQSPYRSVVLLDDIDMVSLQPPPEPLTEFSIYNPAYFDSDLSYTFTEAGTLPERFTFSQDGLYLTNIRSVPPDEETSQMGQAFVTLIGLQNGNSIMIDLYDYITQDLFGGGPMALFALRPDNGQFLVWPMCEECPSEVQVRDIISRELVGTFTIPNGDTFTTPIFNATGNYVRIGSTVYDLSAGWPGEPVFESTGYSSTFIGATGIAELGPGGLSVYDLTTGEGELAYTGDNLMSGLHAIRNTDIVVRECERMTDNNCSLIYLANTGSGYEEIGEVYLGDRPIYRISSDGNLIQSGESILVLRDGEIVSDQDGTFLMFNPTLPLFLSVTDNGFDGPSTTIWQFVATPTSTVEETPVPISTDMSDLPNLEEPISKNTDWTPVERDIDGVVMVLVPTGCFDMGSNNNTDAEKPVHEICFDEPFWIDKYEVTNAQYGGADEISECSDISSADNEPRNCLDWFEARDYCETRGGRLPTTAEWEYAARGPDSLIYPWGNDFVEDNAVYMDTSNWRTAPVGSYPGGASWVGALDLSGNVWEWTSSLNANYPYSDAHESSSNTGNRRVLRGGSFFGSPLDLRAAYRIGESPDNGDEHDGVRCVRDSE